MALNKHYYIIGQGAIACLWASYIAQQGMLPVLICRSLTASPKPKPQKVQYNTLDKQQTDSTINQIESDILMTDFAILHQQQKLAHFQPIKNLIVATKSQDTENAILTALPFLAPTCKILLLCNGYGIHEIVDQHLKSNKLLASLYAGVISDGALLESPLKVMHTGKGKTLIGLYNQSNGFNNSTSVNDSHNAKGSPSANGFHNTNSRGINTEKNFITIDEFGNNSILNIEQADDIKLKIIQKFFINCAINPLTVFYQCQNGGLYQDPSIHQAFKNLCDELNTLYQALAPIMLQTDDKNTVKEGWSNFDIYTEATNVAKITACNTSSMLKDWQAKRPLEIRFLTHKLVHMAVKYRLDCSLNQQLLDAVSNKRS